MKKILFAFIPIIIITLLISTLTRKPKLTYIIYNLDSSCQKNLILNKSDKEFIKSFIKSMGTPAKSFELYFGTPLTIEILSDTTIKKYCFDSKVALYSEVDKNNNLLESKQIILHKDKYDELVKYLNGIKDKQLISEELYNKKYNIIKNSSK